ncbi:MAG: hypothetical protein WDZ77_00975 [Candidatus Pacearchaeota archaeon]
MSVGTFLQSYGFYGGGFGQVLTQWEQAGVFAYILPFLLIFALVYGILNKMNLFGTENNKSINAVISLAVGLMALQFGVVSVFFADILPRLGVVLMIVLVFLVVSGLFGNPRNKGWTNFMMWGSVIIAVVIVLQSLEIFQNSFSNFLYLIPPGWWYAIVLLIVVIAIVAGSRSSTTEDNQSLYVQSLLPDSRK